MSRYLVVTEGANPSTAETVIATGDERLVRAALLAMFGSLTPDISAGVVVVEGSAVATPALPQQLSEVS